MYGVFTYIDPITINQMCGVYLPTIPMDPWSHAINFPSESIRRREIDPEKGVLCFFFSVWFGENIEKHVGLSCRIPTLPSIQLACIYCV